MTEPAGSSKPAPLGLGDSPESPSPTDYAKLVRRFENAAAHAWQQDEHASPRRGRELHAAVDARRQDLIDAIEALVARVAEAKLRAAAPMIGRAVLEQAAGAGCFSVGSAPDCPCISCRAKVALAVERAEAKEQQ